MKSGERKDLRRCEAQTVEEGGDKNETLRRSGKLLEAEVHILGFEEIISAQLIRNASNEEKAK